RWPRDWISDVCSSDLNIRATNDKTLDDLIDLQAKQARDPAARAKTLKDIQRRIIDQAAYQQITMPQAVFMHWPYVKNFNPNSNTSEERRGGNDDTAPW